MGGYAALIIILGLINAQHEEVATKEPIRPRSGQEISLQAGAGK